MKPELQRRIQRYGWDKASTYYETGWQEQLWPAQESLLAEADPQSGETVLDISCGTGLVTIPMAEIIQPDGMVTGIDLSEGMIDEVRSRVNQRDIGNIALKNMNAENLDFLNNTFDLGICSLGLMYYPHPEKALGEMFRVLKPGRRAVALVWGERKKCGWAEIFPITDRRVKSEVCPLFFQLGRGGLLSEAFKKAGFQEITSNRFSYDLHFHDAEQACTAAFLGGAVALAYRKFDDQTKKEVQREYLDSIEHFRDIKSYDVPGEFVIAKGIKRQNKSM